MLMSAKRPAFQILFAKLRPLAKAASTFSLSRLMSVPTAHWLMTV